MSNKTTNDGGPAFPWEQSPGNQNNLGLSKREWFSGLALQGILSSVPDGIRFANIADRTLEAWAKTSVRQADVLLEALQIDEGVER